MYRNVHGDVMFWSFLSLPRGFMFYDNSERVFSVSDGHLTVHNWRVLRECGEYCQQQLFHLFIYYVI